jgi:hypothetical protein
MRPAVRVARAWGYGVAELPERRVDRLPLRPAREIASRLMACDAVCSWVGLPEAVAATDRLRAYAERNGLAAWMTEAERRLWEAGRAAASSPSREELWPLAWALGFDPAPPPDGATVAEKRLHGILCDFLPGLDARVEDLCGRPRAAAEVAAVEELFFYCAEHAASLPAGFDPAVHGEVIRRRRRALTFCLGGPWDDVAP